MVINTTFMRLAIDANRTIRQVQEDFASFFPYLKLEFLRQDRKAQERYPGITLHTASLRLQDVSKTAPESDQEIEFSDDTTVQELEQAFKSKVGVNAQVFRKSGNLWLETTMTDSWTLKQQNDHGKEISNNIGRTNRNSL